MYCPKRNRDTFPTHTRVSVNERAQLGCAMQGAAAADLGDGDAADIVHFRVRHFGGVVTFLVENVPVCLPSSNPRNRTHAH